MRSQPKRFVVEMKRGSSRAAFASPDPSAERFSSAEQALFGSPARPSDAAPPEAEKPRGRVLPSLIEPPPPVIEIPEAPRRGRKPGSKNKPKPPQAAADRGAIFKGRGPSPGTAAEQTSVPEPIRDEPAPAADASAPVGANRARSRLRERSGIIKRYVLGVEPQPGQPGFRQSRRPAASR